MASAGAGGKGIEVEHEDANGGIGNDDGDEARVRRDAGKGVADGERNGLRRAHVQFADAGHEHAGTQRLEGEDRGFVLAGQRMRRALLRR